MPIDYKNYPYNWDEIRWDILTKAEHRCEFCGVENYSVGYRSAGEFVVKPSLFNISQDMIRKINDAFSLDIGAKIIKIVLTIAHLDQNPMNNDPSNLRSLCQKCHLDFDRKYKGKRKIKKDLTLYG